MAGPALEKMALITEEEAMVQMKALIPSETMSSSKRMVIMARVKALL